MVKIGTRLLDKNDEDRDTQEQKGDQSTEI
jgi:hypothetical protein